MNKSKIAFIIINVLLYFYGCNPADPKIELPLLELSLEDVSCTEAWLKISGAPGQGITLNRDNKEILKITLSSEDTLIKNDSLLPNREYSYQMFSSDNSVFSEKISVRTLDTTSHNFTWQTWEFGELGDSRLYDVAIIDENNIWAVGAIYIKDTLGGDYKTYNAIHWNGSVWQKKTDIFLCDMRTTK